MSITRRQHYVWRHYLEAWTNNGKVSVLRSDGSCFQANPQNIAVEKDFYRLPILSQQHEDFVKLFIERSIPNGTLRKLATGWLDNFAAPSRLRRVLATKNLPRAEFDKQLEAIEIQSEENFHSQIEGSAVKLLDQLRNARGDLWQDDKAALEFAFFISLQHLRTRGMRDRVIANFDQEPQREIAEKCWPIFRAIFATNIGWSLYSERSSWRLRILHTGIQSQFITSDQPTLNLKSGKNHNDLALFYPVSPKVAALLEHRDETSAIGNQENLTDDIVTSLNSKMLEDSYEQIFGIDSQYLVKLAAKK